MADSCAQTVGLDKTYGAMFIGLVVATFLQGVLSVQAFYYYENFPRDPFHLKALVAVVWTLDLVHLILISQALYHYLVTSWGNPHTLLFSTRALDLHLIFVGLSTILCQTFFLQRIWVFSSKNYFLTAFLTLGCISTFVLELIKTAFIDRGDLSVAFFREFKAGVIALFSSSAGVDFVMASLLCFYLLKTRERSGRLKPLVYRLIQYTVATGALTSIVAIACLISYLVDPKSFAYIAIHFSVGRMYTNALLVTLNARQRLRKTFVNDSDGGQSQRLDVFTTTAPGSRARAHAVHDISRSAIFDNRSSRSRSGGHTGTGTETVSGTRSAPDRSPRGDLIVAVQSITLSKELAARNDSLEPESMS